MCEKENSRLTYHDRSHIVDREQSRRLPLLDRARLYHLVAHHSKTQDSRLRPELHCDLFSVLYCHGAVD